MKINYQFVKRNIANEDFLVPVGTGAQKFKGLFALTDVAAYIWDQLPEVNSDEEMVAMILEEYEVSQEDAKKDVAEFLGKLREMEIIA